MLTGAVLWRFEESTLQASARAVCTLHSVTGSHYGEEQEKRETDRSRRDSERNIDVQVDTVDRGHRSKRDLHGQVNVQHHTDMSDGRVIEVRRRRVRRAFMHGVKQHMLDCISRNRNGCDGGSRRSTLKTHA